QPRQGPGLPAVVAPPGERGLEARLVADHGEQLYGRLFALRRPQAHGVDLARGGDPGGTVQRAAGGFTPPQPDVDLAGGGAARIVAVEGGERGEAPRGGRQGTRGEQALREPGLTGCSAGAGGPASHAAHLAFEGGEDDAVSVAPPSKRRITGR